MWNLTQELKIENNPWINEKCIYITKTETIRHSEFDFTESFGGKKARISIFKDDKANVIAKEELITQIQILIYSIDDLELRMLLKQSYWTLNAKNFLMIRLNKVILKYTTAD